MDQEQIAANIRRARSYLRTLPAMAQMQDPPARATIAHDLIIRISGPDGLPKELLAGIGGTSEVPSPSWFFRAALASQVAMFIAMRSAEESAVLEDLEVVVHAETDDRGALGMDEEIPPGPLSMTITVRYSRSSADEDTTRRIIDWAVAHSPVHDAVTRSVPVTVAIEKSAPAGEEASNLRS
ncbi:OsmC family protein [Naasia sp. SYSU D00948]|uniref:OsmC family protein n=1 Tax=Naasia sp. SYSU D00948 TaxID=2817379 RepID=UPI001B3116E1|nr:OsmC family protein [Naasia sp. SYSU D00948]